MFDELAEPAFVGQRGEKRVRRFVQLARVVRKPLRQRLRSGKIRFPRFVAGVDVAGIPLERRVDLISCFNADSPPLLQLCKMELRAPRPKMRFVPSRASRLFVCPDRASARGFRRAENGAAVIKEQPCAPSVHKTAAVQSAGRPPRRSSLLHSAGSAPSPFRLLFCQYITRRRRMRACAEGFAAIRSVRRMFGKTARTASSAPARKPNAGAGLCIGFPAKRA